MLAKRPEVHAYIPGITASNEKEKGKRVAERGNATEMGVNGSGYTPGTTQPLCGEHYSEAVSILKHRLICIHYMQEIFGGSGLWPAW